MSNNALYVYGIVKSAPLKWKGTGLNEEVVYTVPEGKFSALVHDCEEKPYLSEDPNKIKELIIAHNNVLNRAMIDFGGVIPFSFNTIITKGENSVRFNLKRWLNDDKERLEKVWNKVRGKKEYGIRIYYDKSKLIQEASGSTEVKEIEEIRQGKSSGLSYLLQGKAENKIREVVQNRINQFKQQFYYDINKITEDLIVNTSRISINEEKDLLLSLSVLIEDNQIDKIVSILEKTGKDIPFHLAGPFAPYSFVENETKQ